MPSKMADSLQNAITKHAGTERATYVRQWENFSMKNITNQKIGTRKLHSQVSRLLL